MSPRSVQDGWTTFWYRINREERLRFLTEKKARAVKAQERKDAEKLLEDWSIFWSTIKREERLILTRSRRSGNAEQKGS